MRIEWNKVTWYSKLLALIVFTAFPLLSFYLGVQYQKAIDQLQIYDLQVRQNKLASPAHQNVEQPMQSKNLATQNPANPAYLVTQIDTSTSLSTSISSWKTYRNEKYGFEIQFPQSWIVDEQKDYSGFRDPQWMKLDELVGDVLDVSIFKNISKEEAIRKAGFETREEAVEEVGQSWKLEEVNYFARGSSAGPPTPAHEISLNGNPALIADVPTRRYGTNGYVGAGEGKRLIIFSTNKYASIHVFDPPSFINKILSTFKFTD